MEGESHLDGQMVHAEMHHEGRHMATLKWGCGCTLVLGTWVAKTSCPWRACHTGWRIPQQNPHFLETQAKVDDEGDEGDEETALVPVQSYASMRGGGPKPNVSCGSDCDSGFDAQFLVGRPNQMASVHPDKVSVPTRHMDPDIHGSLNQKAGTLEPRRSLPRLI